MSGRTVTLVDGEKQWAPVTTAVCVICLVAGLVCLAFSGARVFASASTTRACIWMACALAWALPTASNAYYRATHDLPTVGMVPVAVFSVVPAALAYVILVGLGSLLGWVALLALACSLGVTAFFCWWFVRLHAAYARAPRPRPDAVIIVLGGAVRNGRCCRTLVRRLHTALVLWQESPRRTLLLTGGPAVTGDGTEADAMARWLMDHDVDEKALILEKRARNTEQNLQFSIELLSDQSSGPVLANAQLCVLSSDYHLYRALGEGRRLGLDLVPIPSRTPWASRPQQWSREVLTILYGRVG